MIDWAMKIGVEGCMCVHIDKQIMHHAKGG